nr:protein quiver-like isoform X1 [Lepeophtheirus salmonis]
MQRTKMVFWGDLTLISSIAIVLYLTFQSILQVDGAGGDCISDSVIECFECNSWEDERCNDPFNYTLHKENMPPLLPCEGCCVKMVQFIGTEHYQIKRTCTDHFEVNFFMVNHACMTEGHRHGRMCFCEEDECNYGPWNRVSSLSLILNIIIGFLLNS